ncbi:MAG TPA: phospho-N-acetylmuramoyl-pentapeptide-transferase [Dehalococcoidia bacterium]|nr:phospho-N-acetylmuramoyl-pentapeptide-transferase [Dehalococcoidia bacterium]
MVYACACALAAMAISLAAGRPIVTALRLLKIGKAESGEEPAEYAKRAGKPTMGGFIFLAGILPVGAFIALDRDGDIFLPLAAMAVAALAGMADDAQTLVGRQRVTGHERWLWLVKWGVLVGIGLAAALVLYYQLDLQHAVLPAFIGDSYSLGLLYIPVVVAVFVVAVSGALPTDGMDGLMAGVSIFAFLAYAVIALSQGQEALGAFALAVTGACAGYLWYNASPATVIMGEVGAQALAVGWVVVAFMTGWWLLMPVIGVIFVAEGLSDVIQIAYFKRTGGKRVFKMAPIHYHFQLSGWAETQVVTRFWLVGAAGALAGIALALAE